MNKLKDIRNQIIKDPENHKHIEKGYEPIFFVSENTKILMIGQAPGIKTQLKGEVFKDRSGDTLRNWLGVDEKTFYDSNIFGVLPMDFFYPGKGKTGDLPPRNDFSKKWHPLILKEMKQLKLIILIGNYAVKNYLGDKYEKNLTETVRNYKKYLPKYFPLVHPSPLNFRWHNNNPWFMDVLVDLKQLINELINE